MADFKNPDVIELRTELPLTSMFKVDKSALISEARGPDLDHPVGKTMGVRAFGPHPHRFDRHYSPNR